MSKKFRVIKDESLLKKPLKTNIKWTRQKLIFIGIGTLIPYSMIVSSMISAGMPTGAIISMILVPIVMVIAYSLLYNLTKNL